MTTALSTEDFVDAVMEAADPGYLEDYAAKTMTDAEIIAAMQSIPPNEIESMPTAGAGGGAWYTYATGTMANTNTTYYYLPVTVSSSTVNYTVSYNGVAAFGGGGTYFNTNDWVYSTGTNTSVNLPEEPMVDQPWTEEHATREWVRAEQQDWLDAERQWLNGWLTAEREWRSREGERQRAAAKAKAQALLMSLLPEPEKERYRLQGFFEVLGSHGGRYRIKRTSAGAFR
jgi:hypothetical protein